MCSYYSNKFIAIPGNIVVLLWHRSVVPPSFLGFCPRCSLHLNKHKVLTYMDEVFYFITFSNVAYIYLRYMFYCLGDFCFVYKIIIMLSLQSQINIKIMFKIIFNSGFNSKVCNFIILYISTLIFVI